MIGHEEETRTRTRRPLDQRIKDHEAMIERLKKQQQGGTLHGTDAGKFLRAAFLNLLKAQDELQRGTVIEDEDDAVHVSENLDEAILHMGSIWLNQALRPVAIRTR